MDEYNNQEIGRTFEEGKRLFNLLKDYTIVEIVEKVSSILTVIILLLLIIALGSIAIFFLCMGLYTCLEKSTGSPALSYLITALVPITLLVLIFIFRNVLVDNPLIKYLTDLFYKK